MLDELQVLSVGFVSLRGGFDVSTPAGRLMAGVLASVAAYETEVRKERQLAASPRRKPKANLGVVEKLAHGSSSRKKRKP